MLIYSDSSVRAYKNLNFIQDQFKRCSEVDQTTSPVLNKRNIYFLKSIGLKVKKSEKLK